MKNYKFSFLILSVLLLASACSGIIDREEKDVIPASQVLNTLGGVEAVLFQVYEIARSVHENNEISVYKQCGTDLVVNGTHLIDGNAGGMVGMNMYSNGLAANSGPLTSMWDNYYRAISNCNLVIQASESFPTRDESEEAAILKFRGEAKALRAYVYLELVRRWENIPLAVPLPEGSSPVREAPLASPSEIYDLILSDLTEAVELLPRRAESSGVGAPSKGLANLLLMEANMDLGNWADAAAAAEAVINDGSYELQSLDYIFGLEGGKEGEESNKEIIFSWVFDPAIQARPQRTVQMFVPLYDRVPGVARTLEQGARPWSRLSPSPYYWTLFDEDDGRLDTWHKINWYIDDEEAVMEGWDLKNGDIATKEYVLAWADGRDREARYTEPTTIKNWEDGTYGRTEADAEGFRNVIVYRYAQAFIVGAEAHFRNGNTDRALELINTIRDRAFGDTEHRFTTLDEETILEENARELGHEGHRWYTLKRLGLLVERVRLHNSDGAPNIQPYHVRWPIPQTFIDLAGVSQNTGY
ncbi:RagB/SusD family nutrient uptake outer membrane protein [Flavilitoribacter nigricans]|nr:RagB/SusD family nutrient uptake outer membrane protein [Flavilitoribacter nigricans]